ncbi:MAG TPA: hypothetical protein VFT95_21615, partial [Micromonosporaceae bacterium]|nr:hypothetical protein [Micromonosporaceae bacterium]
GNAWWAVQLATGTQVAMASAAFSTSPGTVTGSWGFGAPPDGATVMSAYVTGQSTGVKITELYLDVDSRERPTFTPQVLDGTGAVSFLISDTSQPVLRVNAVDLDGLAARQYRYWVTSGADTVWDTGIISGPAANQQTDALDNGAYTGHFMVWSTIGQNGEYASAEGIYDFTVQVGLLTPPDNPTVVPVPDTPFYEIEACAPYVGNLDGDVGWIELQRVDCNAVATTIATGGPLATGECFTWTDFTLPRTGAGATCEYSPEPCCSYYRVRTVGRIDGDLRISVWSDVYDPAIPAGMIVMWPDTEGSIPDGWDRVAELDGRYPKGIATSGTEPGSLGGAATHTHTTPGHTHDETHSHTVTGNTGTVVGTVNSHDGAAGSMAMLNSHFHTRSAVNSQAVASGSTSPASGTASNHPAWVEGIAIASNGSPLGVPDGAIAPMPDISPSGWDTFADATGRFLRSPATGFGGGATSASTVDAHTHSVDAHTHTGTSHTHTSPNTGGTASNRSLLAGPTSVLWTTTHSHPMTVGSASSAALASASGGTSGAGAADLRPPFTNVRVRQNTSGVPDLPVGLICAWRGDLGAIPDNWALCDGTGGTLDLIGRYLQGATSSIGTTGGSAAGHTHTGASHTHTTSGHAHTTAVGSAATATMNASSTNTVTVATGTHTHTSSDTDSATPTVASGDTGTLASATTEPPFSEVAFVQLMELPTPPPDPETFCLTWDDSQHLIRTTGPSGPMWAPILGKFEWTVQRPFTVATGINGTRFVTSAPPGGRNLRMSAAVESDADFAALHAILSRPLVLISPSDANEVWAAPVAHSMRVVKIGRIRQVTAEFIGTGPEPAPQLADVGA